MMFNSIDSSVNSNGKLKFNTGDVI
jgi:hypothetical protein